jgi:carboxylesterase
VIPPVHPYDRRKTAPFAFGEKGAPCLLLHGFTGSPWDLVPLAQALQAHGFRGRVPLLPGHGETPEAMAQVHASDWLGSAATALQALTQETGTAVHVAGFSMGALLALVLAARRPEQVRSLALLAPAARLQGWGAIAATRLRDGPLARLLPYQKKGPPDLEDAQARAEAPSPARFPTMSLFELFTLQDVADALAPAVRAPALLVVARHDHVVDGTAARRLFHRVPGAQREVELPRGFHGLARDSSGPELAQTVSDFFSQAP